MDGILALDKPKGITSHECVHKLRTLTQQRKIGHTGTLDPGARGVLITCLGQATKVVQYMSEDDKTYIATITLGRATTTEDAEGEAVEEKTMTAPIPAQEIAHALKQWAGTITQVPPMYSAIKVGGRRLYEYAREGKVIERPQRTVQISDLRLTDTPIRFSEGMQSFSVHVHCSKGTYIRTLAHDIGRTLGYPAHMSALLRTSCGVFSLDDCFTFEQVKQLAEANCLQNALSPLGFGLTSFKKISVSDETAIKIQNGAVLPLPEGLEGKRFTIYNKTGRLLAIYQPHPSKAAWMKPERVFSYSNTPKEPGIHGNE